MIEPIRLSLEVDCTPAEAFALWTSHTSLWWPPSHKTSGDPEASVHLESRVGGRVFERARDGREVDWGEVLIWDPPRTLSYFWHIATVRADATVVRIAFTPLEADRTRIEIEHGGWEQLGSKGAAWRERNTGGWRGVLPVFQDACRNRTWP